MLALWHTLVAKGGKSMDQLQKGVGVALGGGKTWLLRTF